MQTEDSLSRRSDYENRVEHDNTKSVLLKLEFFAIANIDANYKSVFDDSKILKEVKTALLSNEVMKDYELLFSSEPREFFKSLQN